MSLFPDTIKILIFDENSQKLIPNIATKIKLFASNKNDYNFILPLSDERGCIKIRKDWLEEEIRKEQALFIMDYSSMLEDCKPQIELSIFDAESVSRAANSMCLFQDVTGISDDEISKFRTADNSRYFPRVENIKLEGTKTLSIEILLKARGQHSEQSGV